MDYGLHHHGELCCTDKWFSALAAAERGERVTITKNGKAVAEIGPPTAKKGGLDFARMEQVRKEMGLGKPDHPLDEAWRKRFDDPAWTREIFGPEYFDDEPDAAA